jgi:hypothetical protein
MNTSGGERHAHDGEPGQVQPAATEQEDTLSHPTGEPEDEAAHEQGMHHLRESQGQHSKVDFRGADTQQADEARQRRRSQDADEQSDLERLDVCKERQEAPRVGAHPKIGRLTE